MVRASGSRGRPAGRSRGQGRGRGRGNPHGNNYAPQQSNRQPGRSVVPASTNDQDMNADLPERFHRGSNRGRFVGSNDLPSAPQNDFDISLNIDIRKYMQEQANIHASNEKEKWIDSPEIPLSSEIQLADGTTVDLIPNKKDEKFRSVRSYLKTHYSLLREDTVGPLRDAVDKFRRDPELVDSGDMSIYEKVHISGFTFTNMGIAARVKFSTRRAGRRILWSASKRLVSGSMVALTPAKDCFRNLCIVAIIAARPLEHLERSPPEVDLFFGCPQDIQVDPQVEYLMVEAKQGYFEAYRHTLKAFQKMSRESFPLSPHITGAEIDAAAPQYLAEWSNRSLVAAFDSSANVTEDFSSVDIVHDWPQVPSETSLDESQWDALHQMLTNKLAIVQGPPGTGKTYVSKVALQIMVQNRAVDDPPIIIAAHTNHALDQLLKHVSVFDPNYIRLGGRSTNPDIKRRVLFEIRQRERIPLIPGSLFKPAQKKMDREYVKFGVILSIFDDTDDVISSEKLFQLGVINAKQHQSLIDAANDFVTTDTASQGPIRHWLHRAPVPFEVKYDDDSYGFEDAEEDLEIEQLRETEAEHGVADEEDLEMLKGPWLAVSDDWTVATPSDNDLEKAKRWLDTKDDLWDIPEYLRGPVYLTMKARAKELVLFKFRQEAQEYMKIVEELKIGKWERDAVFLKRANVIGLTTTGLSKYRPLIASLRPKVVLVEEAAEVLEGPVAAACMESVEHLILVGDHQQLQGHCALSDLEDNPFYLNISMFERLIGVGMPYRTLSQQRRMIPEVRELISSLYPSLRDHHSIFARAKLPQWGTGSVRSFFFHHEWHERKDESLSTLNEEEARMVAKFYRHLLRHNVPPPAITILTFYNGQRKRILRELRDDPETTGTYNNVKTVDSYQGEENDIVILSLVRSNTEGQIGFLGVSNRVCVALSRARYGFYLFGNGYQLSEKDALWSKVGQLMSEARPKRFGPELPLVCLEHKKVRTVRWPEDFDHGDGGCDLLCGGELPCGHKCLRRCHPIPHDKLPCNELCHKRLNCGHICAKSCHEICYCDCEAFHFNTQRQSDIFAMSQHENEPAAHQTVGSSSGLPVDISAEGSRLDQSGTQNGLSTPVKAKQSGKALARGGAAFQPILGSSRESFHETVLTADALCEKQPSTQNWTTFAEGGVKQDDSDRGRSESSGRITEPNNLLDLSPSRDADGVVENSVEKRLGRDRSKFTQTYRPARETTREQIKRPTNKGTMNGVQNLMD